MSADLRFRVDGRGDSLVVQGPGWGPPVDYLRVTLVPLLAGRFGVVSYDVRGSGENRESEAGSAELAGRVADLAAVAEQADRSRFVLLGHSHGALIAAAFARRYPGRIRALVLVSPGLAGRPTGEGTTVVEGWSDDPERADAVRALREGPGPAPDDRRLARWIRRCMPGHFADLAKMEEFGRALRGAPLPSSAAFSSTTRAAREDWRSIWDGEWGVPALYVSGRFDPLAPPDAVEEVARQAPGATHAIFERSGHYPWVEEPERFLETLEAFLATT